jgi:maltose O-acetyltransferase
MLKKMIHDLKYNIKIQRYKKSIRYLIKKGLALGKNVTIGPTAWIDYDYPYLISIGDNSTVSKGCRLIAHDATTYNFLAGHTRIGKIVIKENCYIGENVIILPGVTIGPNVLVAAGSVVNKDIPANSCVAGVPARFYAKFDEFIKKHKDNIEAMPVFDFTEIQKGINEELKEKIKTVVKENVAYVKGYRGRFPWTWNEDENRAKIIDIGQGDMS